MRTLVVHCHPDPESFTAAVRDRAVEALRGRGRRGARHRPLRRRVRSRAQRRGAARHLEPGPDPAVAGHAADLQWCEQLVLVYPTWWSGQPAMLKGWIDRVWVKDVAFDLPAESNRVHARLHNVRRIVAITTHGSSKLVNALEGETGKRMVTRTLRAVCHPLARTTWIAMYGVDTSSDDDAPGLPRPRRAEAAMTPAGAIALARRPARASELARGRALDARRSSRRAGGGDRCLLAELDYALRPRVHERRVPSVGAIIEPTTPVEQWEIGHAARRHPPAGRGDAADRSPAVRRRPVELDHPARHAATTSGPCSTGRPAPSATSSCSPRSTGATLVQRHPNGQVRDRRRPTACCGGTA